jgi:hypothetical protein
VVLHGGLQAVLIGAGKLLLFPLLPTAPDRANGMNNATRREMPGPGNDRLTSGTSLGVFLACLGHDTGSTSAMNGTINAATASQTTVRSIHNSRGALCGDVPGD